MLIRVFICIFNISNMCKRLMQRHPTKRPTGVVQTLGRGCPNLLWRGRRAVANEISERHACPPTVQCLHGSASSFIIIRSRLSFTQGFTLFSTTIEKNFPQTFLCPSTVSYQHHESKRCRNLTKSTSCHTVDPGMPEAQSQVVRNDIKCLIFCWCRV